MTGTHSPEPSSSNTPSSSTSPPRRPPRATPPTQPLPPVPGRPPLNSSVSSPPRIPSRLSGNTTSRKEMNSPKLAPSPLSPPATTTKSRAPGRPDLRQTASANDTRTRSNTCSQQKQLARDAGLARSRGASDAQYHRSRSQRDHSQLPPGAFDPLRRNQTPPPPPPSSFPATKATTSAPHASAILPSFLPFDAADDDLDTTEFGARNDMSSDSSRAPTPQSRFHSSHSSKFLSKIRAKASAHALRNSTPTTESSGFSSPRTSEETLTELFDEDFSSGSIKAVIRQRARTLSRSSPVPQAPSKLRLSKNLENRSSVRFPEEDDSPTDCEEDAEGLEDASFATVKAPAGYQRPSAFEVKDVVIRNGMRVAPHPVWEVPYPVGFSCAALQSDDKTYDLVKALQPDRSSPSFYHFKHAPSMVLDLGCGVGRWVIEAATEWTKTRFVGLDLMDLQPDLSEKQYEEIRDRVQWVHNNFVQFKLPFPDAHFDFIRMSFVALAVPESKWRFLVKEIRRVLKPSGVLEWIDEEPVFAMSPSYCPNKASTFTNAKQLQSDFTDMLRARRVDNALRCFSDELKGLKGLFEMTKPKFDKFKLWLPGPGTELQSRSSYELGLMRSGSPAALMRSGSPAGTSTLSRTHQMARELKRSLGGSGDSVSSAPVTTQERASLDGNEKALPAIPLPHFTPQGLMVIAERTDEKGNKYHENNLLPLTAEDIEIHAGRNYQILLNSREAIWAQRQAPAPKTGEAAASREQFDNQLWKYECERWARLHLPAPTWYDSDDDHHSGSRIRGRKSPRPLSMTVMMPPTGQKPTIVRSIFVMTCKSL